MALYKEIFQAIMEGSTSSRMSLALEVSEEIRERTLLNPVWYCVKNETFIAKKVGRRRCASRVGGVNDFHTAAEFGCGKFWMVKISEKISK